MNTGEDSEHTPAKKTPWLRLVLGLAVFAGVIAYWLPSWGEVWARVEFVPGYFALGLAATTAASLVTAARWQCMVEAMGGTPLPYRVYLHTLVLTKVLGQVSSTLVMDTLGRGVLLQQAGSTRGVGHTMTQAVLERLFDVVLPAMMLAWTFLYIQPTTDGATSLALFGGIALVFLLLAGKSLLPLSRIALAVYGRLKRVEATRDNEVPSIPGSVANKVAVYSLLRYLTVIAQFWLVANAVGVGLSLPDITAATPLAQLASAIGITPGALGIQEAGWGGALALLGTPAAAIALFVLSQRVVISGNFLLLTLVTRPFATAANTSQ